MNKVIFFVGESGSGKTSLIKHCLERFPTLFYYIKSTTTRPIRDGEVDGVDYDFCTLAQFESQRDEMVQTVSFGGNSYGTAIDEFRVDQPIGILAVTHEGIWDIINGLQKFDVGMEFEVVFWYTPDEVLRSRGVDEERITRGDIRGGFLRTYQAGDYLQIPTRIVADQVTFRNPLDFMKHNEKLMKELL